MAWGQGPVQYTWQVPTILLTPPTTSWPNLYCARTHTHTQISTYYLSPKFPQLDLILLGKANHFVGNCISSFSAFVKRERDFLKKRSDFFGLKEIKANYVPQKVRNELWQNLHSVMFFTVSHIIHVYYVRHYKNNVTSMIVYNRKGNSFWKKKIWKMVQWCRVWCTICSKMSAGVRM